LLGLILYLLLEAGYPKSVEAGSAFQKREGEREGEREDGGGTIAPCTRKALI
jgi:hypothetical protein